jgi:hypothetical protein
MKAIILPLLAGAVWAAPAVANELAAAEEPAKAEPKICRVDRATGSLARRNRICLTRAQWDALRRDTKQGVEDIQRNNNSINPASIDNSGLPPDRR